ncbi:MAG: hypothetical protein BWY52_02059 [Chloroflexi bacterium ADurb.Bin325]|nr:MAG: hypothetical protein BWY52_02059 [Chloroflexi bacterium ADurb.Bin325]
MQKTLLWGLAALGVVLIVAGALLILQPAAQPAPAAAANAAAPATMPTARSPLSLGGDGVARISPQALYGQLQSANPPLVWDLRAASLYEQGHVPGSRLVGISEVEALSQGLAKDRPIVTLCA